MKKISETIGKIKVWQQRLSSNISVINFIMLFYLYITESPLGWEWYHWMLLIVVSITLVVYIDTKFIMPQAFGYTFKKNPGQQYLKKKVKENSEKLDLIIKHLGLTYGDK